MDMDQNSSDTMPYLALKRLQKPLTALAGPTRPRIILTFAQSLDGFIGVTGKQLNLSSRDSLYLTHSIRNHVDSILIGIGTVLNDDPSLTTRFIKEPLRDARPIIVDPRLECPLTAKFMSRKPILLACNDGWDLDKRTALEKAGACIICCSGLVQSRVDLKRALERVYLEFKIQSTMIEGGARIIKECLTRPDFVIDDLIVTICPVVLGHGVHGVCGLDFKSIANDLNILLTNVEWQQVGPDMVLSASITKNLK